jgi:hypothetical protein
MILVLLVEEDIGLMLHCNNPIRHMGAMRLSHETLRKRLHFARVVLFARKKISIQAPS